MAGNPVQDPAAPNVQVGYYPTGAPQPTAPVAPASPAAPAAPAAPIDPNSYQGMLANPAAIFEGTDWTPEQAINTFWQHGKGAPRTWWGGGPEFSEDAWNKFMSEDKNRSAFGAFMQDAQRVKDRLAGMGESAPMTLGQYYADPKAGASKLAELETAKAQAEEKAKSEAEKQAAIRKGTAGAIRTWYKHDPERVNQFLGEKGLGPFDPANFDPASEAAAPYLQAVGENGINFTDWNAQFNPTAVTDANRPTDRFFYRDKSGRVQWYDREALRKAGVLIGESAMQKYRGTIGNAANQQALAEEYFRQSPDIARASGMMGADGKVSPEAAEGFRTWYEWQAGLAPKNETAKQAYMERLQGLDAGGRFTNGQNLNVGQFYAGAGSPAPAPASQSAYGKLLPPGGAQLAQQNQQAQAAATAMNSRVDRYRNSYKQAQERALAGTAALAAQNEQAAQLGQIRPTPVQQARAAQGLTGQARQAQRAAAAAGPQGDAAMLQRAQQNATAEKARVQDQARRRAATANQALQRRLTAENPAGDIVVKKPSLSGPTTSQGSSALAAANGGSLGDRANAMRRSRTPELGA